MSAEDASVRNLLTELIDEVSRLVRQELRLAQAEGSERVSEATNGAIAIAGGLLVANCALLILLQALVIALAEFTSLPASAAALIVGVVVAIIAFILIRQGQRRLAPGTLTPERTVRSLRENKDLILEKAQ